MAKVTPILRRQKVGADGHAPIWLRFTDTDRSLYLALGVRIHPRFWNKSQRRVRKGHPNVERINALIQQRLAEVEDVRLQFLAKGAPITAEALRDALQQDKDQSAWCLIRYAESFLEEEKAQGKISRWKNDGTVFRKLRAFAGSPLPIERLTTQLLRTYETHLLTVEGNKSSTVRKNLKVIRTHFRRAKKEGLVPLEVDPFFAYTPPKEERAERPKLSDEELKRLEDLNLGPSGPDGSLEARVRDVFLFSLYSAGTRFADVARLRIGDIHEQKENGVFIARLVYLAGKTKKRTQVPLIPQALQLVQLYRVRTDGKPKAANDLLFPLLEGADLATPKSEWDAIGRANSLVNKYLRRLGERAAVRGRLSFHVARHSFADLARRRGWDVYAISKALQHANLNVTERYLAGFDEDTLGDRLSTLFEENKA